MTTSAVAVNDLTRVFAQSGGRAPIRAADGLTFEVPASARLVALVGPDGAGKSTLMRLLCGLENPDGGAVRIFGRRPDPDDEAFLEAVAYMPQSLGLYKDLSVMENLELFGALKGARPEDGRTTIEHYRHLLALTGLSGVETRPAGKLSGGMKQKLALSVALVRMPELLLLDEPTVGVDPLSRRELWSVIHRMVASTGMTCLFSTAYLEEAEKADWVICLSEGRLLAAESPASMMASVAGQTFRLSLGERPDHEKQRLTRALMEEGVSTSPDDFLDVVPRDGAVEVLTHVPMTIDAVQRVLTRVWGSEESVTIGVAVRSPRLEDAYARMTFGRTPMRDALMPETDGRGTNAKASDIVIEADGVSRRFGDFVAVAESSFAVRRGEIFGLLGPNGAGKTTTFRMLCGLLAPSGGRVEIEGRDLREALATVRADLGYVAQKFSLYERLTVEENLLYFGRSYGFFGRALTDRIEAALDGFGLREARRMPAGDLPVGAKRDLSIACALLHRPGLLFLDEATSGADLASRRSFWRGLTRLAACGTTVVVTTHFMEEAEYCDRFLIQDAGRILAIGTPDEIRREARRAAAGRDVRSIEEAFVAVVNAHRAAAGGVA